MRRHRKNRLSQKYHDLLNLTHRPSNCPSLYFVLLSNVTYFSKIVSSSTITLPSKLFIQTYRTYSKNVFLLDSTKMFKVLQLSPHKWYCIIIGAIKYYPKTYTLTKLLISKWFQPSQLTNSSSNVFAADDDVWHPSYVTRSKKNTKKY